VTTDNSRNLSVVPTIGVSARLCDLLLEPNRRAWQQDCEGKSRFSGYVQLINEFLGRSVATFPLPTQLASTVTLY
jgi:hypothetical protein